MHPPRLTPFKHNPLLGAPPPPRLLTRFLVALDDWTLLCLQPSSGTSPSPSSPPTYTAAWARTEALSDAVDVLFTDLPAPSADAAAGLPPPPGLGETLSIHLKTLAVRRVGGKGLCVPVCTSS